MGGDGGTHAVKKEYMHGGGTADPDAKYNSKSTKDTQEVRSRACALSGEPLAQPIVACELGNLYNKESILEALLEKNLPSEFDHVRSLKDVKEVKFTDNTSSGASKGDDRKWMCPLTGLEFNGVIPFVLLWNNGKVLSEKATREMGEEALQEDYGPFDADDIIKLLPLEGDLVKRVEEMAARREKRGSRKKNKKSKSRVESDGDAVPKKKARANGASTGSLGTNAIVREVISETSTRKKGEGVYASLFHAESQAEKRKNDVFINLA